MVDVVVVVAVVAAAIFVVVLKVVVVVVLLFLSRNHNLVLQGAFHQIRCQASLAVLVDDTQCHDVENLGAAIPVVVVLVIVTGTDELVQARVKVFF